MATPRTRYRGPPGPPLDGNREDWEDWEDDEVISLAGSGDEPLISPTHGTRSEISGGTSKRPEPQPSSLSSHPSVQRLKRLKSRQRQKAQNAKAGIKVVTDMTTFRQQQQQQQQQQQLKQQHVAQQFKPAPQIREVRAGRFVDAAALQALEGGKVPESTSAFGWLKKKPSQIHKNRRIEQLAAEASTQDDLSPAPGPIVIGFAMPSDSDVIISPETAVVETPVDFPMYFSKPAKVSSPKYPTSAWSPDTPDTDDGLTPRGPVGAGFSRRFNESTAPPVPKSSTGAQTLTAAAVDLDGNTPASRNPGNKRYVSQALVSLSEDEGDMETPVTLFEEDGSPVATRQKAPPRGLQRTATVASSRSQGWWDQVTSPFGPKTPVIPEATGPGSPQAEESAEWWKGMDEKKDSSPTRHDNHTSELPQATKTAHRPPKIIIHSVPHSVATSSSTSSPAMVETRAEKTRILPDEGNRASSEVPPPYSPPSKKKKNNIRYRAVFPPGHPLNSMYPPSPGPVSPGLSRTMTSQGAISLSNVPLTPPPVQLPNRAPGSFVTGHRFQGMTGNGPRQKAERQRRRHEKEDAIARKIGGLWKGRGCIPGSGCYGRPGPEGRKRRRVWFGVCAGILGLIILAVVLGVTLSHRGGEYTAPSPWLNLTDFPPIPTGIATVIGPSSDSTSACVEIPTLWTCSLPKEEASSAAPFNANQPSFVFQIQFDNNTRQLWNVTGQEPPHPTPVSASSEARGLDARGGAVGVASLSRRPTDRRRAGSAFDVGFKPDPSPPDFQNIWFLGNTTDGIVSDDKAGEPTPFFISVLESLGDSAGPNMISRRQSSSSNSTKSNSTFIPDFESFLPPPVLDRDGTGAPAVLLAHPSQQPLRLFDRGLPTEHYGFYSYYNKTTYYQSVSSQDPADQDGGSLKSDAKFVVTFLTARYKVEIWTRRSNTTRLVGGNGGVASSANDTQPGTLPYPVTITLDTHGGDPHLKTSFVRSIDDNHHIVRDARILPNDMTVNGNLVNPSFQKVPNPSFGGIDGGSGGCKCVYTNFRMQNRQAMTARTPARGRRSLLTLAIETSCDDSCVAVMEKEGPAARLLFGNKVTSDQRMFGGVHPGLAVVEHAARLGPLVQEALQVLPEATSSSSSSSSSSGGGEDTRRRALPIRDARTGEWTLRRVPDLIAVTRGPGMAASLSVGLTMAKGLALAMQVPLLGVHHMQAHALTPRLVDAMARTGDAAAQQQQTPEFPFLTLLLSGGHTQLVLSRSLTSHKVLAEAETTALGNMLDHAARAVLPSAITSGASDVMYGALLEKFAYPDAPAADNSSSGYDYDGYAPPAKRADELTQFDSGLGWKLPAPLSDRRSLEYNFTGLGSAVQRAVAGKPDMDEAERRVLARAAMKMAFEHVAGRVAAAAAAAAAERAVLAKIRMLVMAGGVASNRFLRHVVRRFLDARGFGNMAIVTPPAALCVDNGAMIAWAGAEMWEAGWRSNDALAILPSRKWSIDPAAEGGGILSSYHQEE
ncbi:glycoprotease family-domain-containing protein [Lasiosphaeria miniovina]|uniref:Glycoprotease family-domain-containing protein n=1 Tax=Lasiosphaeria miniovina TaxID=1954250 RepID=A0AA39ZUI7_9PEZI|nr:glycoprotease family-domain-containing protein [Lasiosphaeria miniovina]KAK0703780.1 glycoprotease family-domain-containing protein [Lasiosphaeria miniovina]